jgi:hypothetical protein
MSSIPSITEWIEMALTTIGVCPELWENLRKELEQWLVKVHTVQISRGVSCWLGGHADFAYVGNPSGCDVG